MNLEIILRDFLVDILRALPPSIPDLTYLLMTDDTITSIMFHGYNDELGTVDSLINGVYQFTQLELGRR